MQAKKKNLRWRWQINRQSFPNYWPSRIGQIPSAFHLSTTSCNFLAKLRAFELVLDDLLNLSVVVTQLMSGKLGCPYKRTMRIRDRGIRRLEHLCPPPTWCSFISSRHRPIWTMGGMVRTQRRTCKMTICLGHHINCHGVELVCCSEKSCYGSACLGQSEIWSRSTYR